MPTDGVICCRYSHKYEALSSNVQLFLCWANNWVKTSFNQLKWADLCGPLYFKSRMSGLLKTQPIMPGLRFEATIVGEECGTLSTWGICGGQKNQIRRFERFWLLSSSSAYMTRDRLPSLRRCRIEVRDEMHPCQPGRMKWCRYEVRAARLVTNWCTAKLCIMHIHLPWGDDVTVMIVTKTQRPRKSEQEKNGNDHCIFQRRIPSTTWCEWGLRMQQSWGPWWSSSRAGSRPPPSPRSIVPRLTARNSIPLNAMQCNSIPFNAEFHSPRTLVTLTDLRCNCIGREHLWLIM